MSVFLVFNELSAIQMAPHLTSANNLLEEFSSVLADPRIKGRKVLITPSELKAVVIELWRVACGAGNERTREPRGDSKGNLSKDKMVFR
jgi:hypothetical protein